MCSKSKGRSLLEVAFYATGTGRALKVIHSLGHGHGLDEAAVTAAARIQFRTASSDGQPVDYVEVAQVQS